MIWDHLDSSGIIWDHLGSSELTEAHRGSCRIPWDHLGSLGIICWDHLGSLWEVSGASLGSGIIWPLLESSGLIWAHLGSSVSIWDHLGSSGIIWEVAGKSLGSLWEVSGRSLGSLWEGLWGSRASKQPQESPRRPGSNYCDTSKLKCKSFSILRRVFKGRCHPVKQRLRVPGSTTWLPNGSRPLVSTPPKTLQA